MSTIAPPSLTAATRRREIVPERMPRPSDTPLPPRRLIDSLDWDTALLLYTQHCEARGLRPATITNYMSYLHQLAKWVDVEPARVTYAQLLTVQTLKVAVSTKQRRRTVFQLFFSWLLSEGYAMDDPALRLPKVRVPRTTPRPLSVAQLEDVLEVCRKRSTRTMILLGAYAGLRVNEIAHVRGEAFNLSANTLTYEAKGGVVRTVELHPIIRGEVAHYPRHGYWFPGEGNRNTAGHVNSKSVSTVIGNAMRRAGIDDRRLTAHSLRHFFGSELVAAGVDIRVVSEMMGHANLQSTMVYTKVPEQKMREGLAALPQATLPGAHFSRAHRRAWLGVTGAAHLLGLSEAETARLARTHGWRYTADNGGLVYAISDVEATARGMRPTTPGAGS